MTVRRRDKQRVVDGVGSRQRRRRRWEWAPIPFEEELKTGTVTIEEYEEHPVRTL